MSGRPSAARIARRASFWLAAGVALLVSHDAVFLAQMGPGQALTSALRDAGHAYWGLASALLVLGGVTGLTIWLLRMWLLRRLARDHPSAAAEPLVGSWRRRALAHWIRLLVLVAIAFAAQENLEHALSHGHAIGLGALLGPEYPLALPVIALVTGLAAAITALVRQREVELLRRLAATRLQPRPQRVVGFLRPTRRQKGNSTPMAVHRALRAPPGVSIFVHV